MPIERAAAARDTLDMESHDSPQDRAEQRRESKRLRALEQALSDRDETIRLLNEALSRALADLERADQTRAAREPAA